jgi:hypothetical protein
MRTRAFAISDPPEPLFTPILPNRCLRRSQGASAADLLPLRCGLIDLDLQLTLSVSIFCSPRFVLLHIKFNQPILYLGNESAPLGYEHGRPPRMGV